MFGLSFLSEFENITFPGNVGHEIVHVITAECCGMLWNTAESLSVMRLSHEIVHVIVAAEYCGML